jgi:hypothetical protein
MTKFSDLPIQAGITSDVNYGDVDHSLHVSRSDAA